MMDYIQAAQQVKPVLQSMGGPLGFVGRAIGLNSEEVESGVPWWAWMGVGVLLGGAVAYSLRHKLERIVES